eukprot:3496033-Rhodomonas_salina.2
MEHTRVGSEAARTQCCAGPGYAAAPKREERQVGQPRDPPRAAVSGQGSQNAKVERTPAEPEPEPEPMTFPESFSLGLALSTASCPSRGASCRSAWRGPSSAIRCVSTGHRA